MPSGLEALARAQAFRKRVGEYQAKADAADSITIREAYLQLAVTYGRLASDMETVARLKDCIVVESEQARSQPQ